MQTYTYKTIAAIVGRRGMVLEHKHYSGKVEAIDEYDAREAAYSQVYRIASIYANKVEASSIAVLPAIVQFSEE